MNAVKGGSIQRSIDTARTLAATQIATSTRIARSSLLKNDLLRAKLKRQAGMRRTLFMMTASTGTSSKPRRRPVSTAAILSMTSMPSVTRANTA